MKFNMSVTFDHPVRVFCLKPGGEVVPPVLLGDELLLIDRNLLSKLKAPERISNPAQKYWVHMFNTHAHRINPILTAYEGCQRRKPTKEEFRSELRQSFGILRALYPHKLVVEHDEATCDHLYDAVRSRLESFQDETAFLQEAAPLAAHRPADRDLLARIDEVVGIARRHGVLGRSLAPLAVVSAICEAKHGEKPSVGKRVVKPSKTYTEGDAHNAIADLHALQWLVTSTSIALGPIALATMDRGLAAFWQAIAAKGAAREPGEMLRFHYRVDSSLCPRLTAAQLDNVRALLAAAHDADPPAASA